MLWHSFILVLALLFHVSISTCRGVEGLSEEDQKNVEYLVKKRQYDKGEYGGYTVAKAHWSQEQDGEKNRVNTAHVRRKRNVDAVTHLHLETDKEQFDLELQHIDPVLTEGAAVVQRWENITWLWEEQYPRDCYMTGHMANNMSNPASMSYCSHLMGSFTNGTNRYWIEFISNTHAEDSSTEHVVMALEGNPSDPDPGPIDDEDSIELPPTMLPQGWDENIYPSASESKKIEKINAEIWFMLDAWWTEWATSIGFESQAEQIELILLKLNAVQLEWGRKERLRYDFKFQVKKLEFWKKNPGWYKIMKGDMTKELNQLAGFNLKQNPIFDLTHLITGHPNPKAYWGNRNGIASSSRACLYTGVGISYKTNPGDPVVVAHEIGHKKKGATCFRQENIKLPLQVDLIEAYPGMLYDDDSICQAWFGPKYRRDREAQIQVGTCQLPWLCANFDDSTPDKFGYVKIIIKPAGGEYCGNGEVCAKVADTKTNKRKCETYKQRGLDPHDVAVIRGAWGKWGPASKCSRTCGTGVKLWWRTCDNPRPQKSPQCKGKDYWATLCNTEPCPDEKDMTTLELKKKRAGIVCAIRKEKKNYPWHRTLSYADRLYGREGDPMGKPYDCKLRCVSQKHGQFIHRDAYEFDGYFPHGYACKWESAGFKPSFADQHRLISRPGLNPRCLMGSCQLFGCDGELGKTKFDACGVCGGSNSTCHLYTGTFKQSLNGGQRESIFNFIGDSDFIDFQVYYDGTVMKGYHVELWTADNEPIISSDTETKIEPTSKDAPITFGGAEWHYSLNAGYIYSEGPFNMNATIKLYCKTTGDNKGVHYSYIVPIASSAPGTGRPNLITMLLTVGVWCLRWQR